MAMTATTLERATGEHSGAREATIDAPRSGRSVRRWVCGVVAVFAGVWVALYVVHVSFPNIRPGAEMVYDAKVRTITHSRVFPEGAKIRVAMFGNSKTLSGFDAMLFDSLSGGATYSYNVGLPNWTEIVDNVEAMCRQGQAPTHVLLQFPWTEKPQKKGDVLHPGINDSLWMDRLFPFRKLPRNLFIFLMRSREKGGVRAFYRYADEQVRLMSEQRGYYFIEGQSHYEGGRLPDDFAVGTDRPNLVNVREVSTGGAEFERLRALSERHGLVVWLVPSYFRVGEYAEPPTLNKEAVAALGAYPRFGVVGPDYLRLPNRFFADPVHLNPEGAAEYTRKLWELVGRRIVGSASGTGVGK